MPCPLWPPTRGSIPGAALERPPSVPSDLCSTAELTHPMPNTYVQVYAAEQLLAAHPPSWAASSAADGSSADGEGGGRGGEAAAHHHPHGVDELAVVVLQVRGEAAGG